MPLLDSLIGSGLDIHSHFDIVRRGAGEEQAKRLHVVNASCDAPAYLSEAPLSDLLLVELSACLPLTWSVGSREPRHV